MIRVMNLSLWALWIAGSVLSLRSARTAVDALLWLGVIGFGLVGFALNW